MRKVKTKKPKGKNTLEMVVIHPYAAGIDVGDKEHVVAVPEGVAAQRVQIFGTMTSDLTAIDDIRFNCHY